MIAPPHVARLNGGRDAAIKAASDAAIVMLHADAGCDLSEQAMGSGEIILFL